MPVCKNPKILVAGFGNVLHGDDGFGVVVAQRLLHSGLPAGVTVVETGIGGMSLVHELMSGYDALLLLDAYRQGGRPGELYLLEPVLPELSQLTAHEQRDYFADTHYATPMRALSFLAHLGHLPAIVRIIGCEPESYEDLRVGLSAPASAAVGRAVAMAIDWVNEFSTAEQSNQHPPFPPQPQPEPEPLPSEAKPQQQFARGEPALPRKKGRG